MNLGRNRLAWIGSVVALSLVTAALTYLSLRSEPEPNQGGGLNAGSAWMVAADGSASLIDGATGQRLDREMVVSPDRGAAVAVEQGASLAYVIDEAAGTVLVLDSRRLSRGDAARRFGQPGGKIRILSSAMSTFVASEATRTIVELDARTLGTKGSPQTFNGDLASLAIDASGAVWGLEDEGVLVRIAHGKQASRSQLPKGLSGDLRLLALQRSLVIIDISGNQAIAVSQKDGSLGRRVPIQFPASITNFLAASRDGSYLVVLSQSTGSLLVADMRTGQVSGPVDLQPVDGTHTFGAPVALAGRAYIPDQTSGDVVVVELNDLTLPTIQRITTPVRPANTLRLFTHGGRVWIDTLTGAGAASLGDNGLVPIVKIDPAAPVIPEDLPPIQDPVPEQPPETTAATTTPATVTTPVTSAAVSTTSTSLTAPTVISTGARSCKVPTLIRRTEADAAQLSSQAGCGFAVQTRESSTDVADGLVIRQNPVSGDLPNGSRVDVVMSTGTKRCTAPNLVGRSEATARSLSIAASCGLAVVGQDWSDLAVGIVTGQTQVVSASLPIGFALQVTLSKGPKPCEVPDLAQLTESAARTKASGALCSLGGTTNESSSTVAKGTIIRQDPVAGTVRPKGSPIAVVISGGLAPCSVPSLSGLNEADARSRATQANCTIGAITTAASLNVDRGLTLSQNPLSGTLPNGSPIVIVTSTACTVPNMVGSTSYAAVAEQHGCRAVNGAGQFSARPVGQVNSQALSEGSRLGPGAQVTVSLSIGHRQPTTLIPGGNGSTGNCSWVAAASWDRTTNRATGTFIAASGWAFLGCSVRVWLVYTAADGAEFSGASVSLTPCSTTDPSCGGSGGATRSAAFNETVVPSNRAQDIVSVTMRHSCPKTDCTR